MIRLYSDNLARILHSQLYTRLHKFCSEYTPEIPAEPVVQDWLTRLYNGDNSLHVLVEIDDKYKITAHAIIQVVVVFNNIVVECKQVERDKPSITQAVEVMEYLDKLQAETNAVCIVAYVDPKYARQIEKRHGYQQRKVMIVKSRREEEDNG